MKKDNDKRRYSRQVVDGAEQAPSRAMLRAVGFTDDDFSKPQVGIASTWSMVTPCNMHIDKLADEAAAGVDAAGGKSVIFNTITVSDGISMGTPGMRYSLVSREVIADSIETVAGAEGFDGLVVVGGCDKNMPGGVMAMARLNRPGRLRLRRHDPARTETARHRLGIRGGGRPRQRRSERSATAGGGEDRHSGTRLLRRHVHRQHDGQRHRGAGHEPAQQLRAGRGLRGQEGRLPPGRRRGVRICSNRASGPRIS